MAIVRLQKTSDYVTEAQHRLHNHLVDGGITAQLPYRHEASQRILGGALFLMTEQIKDKPNVKDTDITSKVRDSFQFTLGNVGDLAIFFPHHPLATYHIGIVDPAKKDVKKYDRHVKDWMNDVFIIRDSLVCSVCVYMTDMSKRCENALDKIVEETKRLYA